MGIDGMDPPTPPAPAALPAVPAAPPTLPVAVPHALSPSRGLFGDEPAHLMALDGSSIVSILAFVEVDELVSLGIALANCGILGQRPDADRHLSAASDGLRTAFEDAAVSAVESLGIAWAALTAEDWPAVALVSPRDSHTGRKVLPPLTALQWLPMPSLITHLGEHAWVPDEAGRCLVAMRWIALSQRQHAPATVTATAPALYTSSCMMGMGMMGMMMGMDMDINCVLETIRWACIPLCARATLLAQRECEMVPAIGLCLRANFDKFETSDKGIGKGDYTFGFAVELPRGWNARLPFGGGLEPDNPIIQEFKVCHLG